MLPKINSAPLKVLEISDFSGGVNYVSDEKIKNNQLKDVDNMWVKDGALKTRPNIKTLLKNDALFENPEIFTKKTDSVYLKGERYFIEAVKERGSEYRLNLRLVNEKEIIKLGFVAFEEDFTFFFAVFKENIYLFLSDGRIFLSEFINEGFQPLREIEKSEIYSPLILTNCKSCYMDSGKINSMLLRGAERFEDFNFLSDRYRMEFSLYDRENYIEAVEGQTDSRVSYMEYGLPYTVKNCKGEIKLQYVDSLGEVYDHTVSCPSEKESEVESTVGPDGLYLHAFFKGDVCHVTLNSSSEKAETQADYVSVSEYVNNNMTIDAPRLRAYRDKVALMTEAVWYGNNSVGINGGSRLFLGGNGKEKNLLLWSDYERPLYFPECNYTYVGDKSQKITALEKQGSSLIIFKEREIYSSSYEAGETEASKQDVTLGEAYFPVKLIHSMIGCTEKNSIQLLRNRLTFFASNGKVSTVKEENQYSERNVFTLSEMIEPKLKNAEGLYSADWNGFYLLFNKNTVFLMDYNTYGYVNIHSLEKESVANMGIPWFKWTLPQEITGAQISGDKLILWVKTDSFINLMTFSDKGEDTYFFERVEDTPVQKEAFKKIHSEMETRLFDFNEPYRMKSLCALMLNVKGEPSVTVTDGFFKDRQWGLYIVPKKRNVKKLGVKIESDGYLEIYGFSLKFRNGGNLWQKAITNI